MSNSTSSAASRTDIQALRAFAIISVVLFHLWPKSFGGGYIGVDVFFVISGFLITGSLWRETEASAKMPFASFWARRARRLLPAALFVILMVTTAAFFTSVAINFLNYKNEAFGSTFYFENFVLLGQNTDYLASGGDASPFEHFWSLSVEEQFYIAWPLLIFIAMLAARLKGKQMSRRGILVVLIVVATVSFGFNVWHTFALQPVAYFNTLGRAWEFAVGGLVAVWLGEPREVEAKRTPWWFVAGALAVFYSATMFDSKTMFPGFAALIPVLGAAALIYGGQSQHFMMPRRFIEFRAWQFLGNISYSLYLWHWPLIILLPIWFAKPLNNGQKILVFGLAVLLAVLTKRTIEDPVRFGRIASLSALKQLALAGAAMALVSGLILAMVITAQNRVQQSWAAQNLNPSLLQLHDDWSSIEKSDCVVSPSSTDFKTCQFGDPNGIKRVAIIGDSHARQFFDSTNEIALSLHFKLFVISKSHCEPMASSLIGSDYDEPSCKAWNQKLETYLASNPRFDLVFNMNAANYSSSSKTAPAAFQALVQSQLARGTKWLVLRDNPVPVSDLPACLETWGETAAAKCAVARKDGFKHNDELADVIKELPGVIYADFSDVFCHTKFCSPVIGTDIVYRDTNHLSRTFIERHLKTSLETLFSKELTK